MSPSLCRYSRTHLETYRYYGSHNRLRRNIRFNCTNALYSLTWPKDGLVFLIRLSFYLSSSIFLVIIFKAFCLSIIIICPQPKHLSLKSTPTLVISHNLLPQGCVFFHFYKCIVFILCNFFINVFPSCFIHHHRPITP